MIGQTFRQDHGGGGEAKLAPEHRTGVRYAGKTKSAQAADKHFEISPMARQHRYLPLHFFEATGSSNKEHVFDAPDKTKNASRHRPEETVTL